jgi:arabinose-5-phosphate isomerase
MCLALGDALAIALLEAKGFAAKDFRALHPGGKLGALLMRVRDVMRTGAAAPLIAPDAPARAALAAMTEGGAGVVGVVDAAGTLIGIITDGDLRRRLTPEAFAGPAAPLMTPNPVSVTPETPLADVVALLNARKITALYALEAGRPVGLVHLHDLLRAGAR